MIIVHREDKWPRDCPAWKTNENIPRAALDCTGAAVKLLPKNPSPALIRDMTWSWMDLTDPCLHVCNQPSCRNPQVSFCTDPGITQETFFLAARFSIVLFCNKFLRATGRCLFFLFMYFQYYFSIFIHFFKIQGIFLWKSAIILSSSSLMLNLSKQKRN